MTEYINVIAGGFDAMAVTFPFGKRRGVSQEDGMRFDVLPC